MVCKLLNFTPFFVGLYFFNSKSQQLLINKNRKIRRDGMIKLLKELTCHYLLIERSYIY